MPRICSRPGCAETATATFAYDLVALRVWLGDLVEDRRPFGHDLCDTHADRLSVPKGWALTDQRREPTPVAPIDASSPMLARAFRAAKAS